MEEDFQLPGIDALASQYLYPTKNLESLALVFLVHDHAKWLQRQEVSELFTDERKPIFEAIDNCKEKVNFREVKNFLSEKYFEDLEIHLENFQKLLDNQELIESESYIFLIEKLKESKQRYDIAKLILSVLPQIKDSDPEKVNQFLRSSLYKVSEKPFERSNFLDEEAAKKRIESIENQKNVKRFPSGIKELDLDNNGGFSISDLVVLIGSQGSGKSLFLGQLAYYGLVSGANIVYFQSEMTLKQSDLRLDTRIADVEYNRMKVGDVRLDEKQYWLDNISNLRSKGGSLDTFYVSRRFFTISNVLNIIEVLRSEGRIVDMVLLDYILLMSVPNAHKHRIPKHEQLEIISEELNNLSNSYDRGDGEKGVFVATVTQGKPKMNKAGLGADMEEVLAYSASIAHYAKQVYVIMKQDELDEAFDRRILKCLKDRNGPSEKHYLLDQRYNHSIFHDPLIKGGKRLQK